QIPACRAVQRDVARRGDVVGRYRIAEEHKRARAANLPDRRRLEGEAIKKGRLLDVSRFGLPAEKFPARDRNRIPRRVAVPNVGVDLTKHLRADRALRGGKDFLLRWPNVAKV